MRITRRKASQRMWIGLAAGAIMSLIGPRPLFVKTAYADSPSPQLQELAVSGMDAQCVEELVFDARD